VYGDDAPDMKNIKVKFDKFLAMGSVLKQSGVHTSTFLKRKSKKFALHSRKAPVNPSINH
jgi:hypothetical protein